MRRSLVFGMGLFSASLLFCGTAVASNVLNVDSECDAIADNIVANCGFETGAFTPEWTVDGPTCCTSVNTGSAHSGNFGIIMGADRSFGGDCLSQTLTTVPDQSYDLSYWVRFSYSGEILVFWNGEIRQRESLQDNPYMQRGFGGLIGTGADTLTFCDGGFDNYLELDDIVVLPSPATQR